MKIIRLPSNAKLIADELPYEEWLGCYEVQTNTIWLNHDANWRILIHEMLHVLTTRFIHPLSPKLENWLDGLINKLF